MTLSKNSISFVKMHMKNGVPYTWFVSLKSGYVSDARSYSNYDDRGRTTSEPLKLSFLPKSVQAFVIDCFTNNRFNTISEDKIGDDVFKIVCFK